jgi:glycosyltransferase involved in cell wall biosynthesis
MKIALDSRFLQKISQGTSTYTLGLINGLVEILPAEDHVHLLSNNPEQILEKHAGERFLNQKTVSIQKIQFGWTPINILGGFALHEFFEKHDIFHTNYLSPIVKIKKTKHVVTIHDIMYKTHAQYFNRKISRGLSILTLPSLKRADHIIAVSDFTKKEILNNFDINENKISVIHESSGISNYPDESGFTFDGIKKKYKIVGKYFIFVGRFAAIKNIENIMQSFYNMKRDDLQLILIGGFDPAFPDKKIQEMIQNKKSNVLVLRGITNKELSFLYKNSLALLFPSFCEGFGLPILEAMSCGTPVITSNTGACAEVAGNAAITITPTEPSELLSAMIKIEGNPELRETLITNGLLHSASFSWKKCATETLAVYNKILGN